MEKPNAVMEANDFLQKARNLISENPLDRLAPKTRAIIDRDNFIADVHCHFFDIKTINIKYFILRFIKDKLGLRDDEVIVKKDDPNIKYLSNSFDTVYENTLLGKEEDSDEDWEGLLKEIEYIEEENIPMTGEEESGTRGVRDVLRNKKILSRKSMREVYEFYLEKFALTRYKEFGFENKDLIVTALMMDLEVGWGIKVRKNMLEKIWELKNLAKEEPVLPYFPADPRRAGDGGDYNLYELFLNAFNPASQSFYGLKIYPGLGYLPSDYRLHPLFEICQEKNIPVLTHCGGESVTTNDREMDVYRMHEKIQIKGKNRQEVAMQLNHPEEWEPVLEKFPNLKLNFGHFGGDTAWEKFAQEGSSPRVKTIMDLMKNYKNVYADFSFNVIEPSLFSIYKSALDAYESTLSKSVYGSDYWVVLGTGDLQKRQKEFLTTVSDHIHKLTCENVKRYLFEV